jgi:DNA primase
MEISDIKITHIIDYLGAKGFQPVKINSNTALYYSPFREEKTPSFNVSMKKNVWFDFGPGEGGNLVKLVMMLENYSLNEALTNLNGNLHSRLVRELPPFDENEHIRITHTRLLQRRSLTKYLDSRRISLIFSRKYLKEANYTVHHKKYFALAFKNDRGGYELRNEFFKGGSSPKYFTTIPGPDPSRLSVFEGFMDFLSACTYYDQIPVCKTIILNSLSFLPRIESELAIAKIVNLYLDNDTAGRKATQKTLDNHPHAKDWAQIVYPNNKDFNEFLMAL